MRKVVLYVDAYVEQGNEYQCPIELVCLSKYTRIHSIDITKRIEIIF
jgi:hypothetical protein